jgi:hypothetical protein
MGVSNNGTNFFWGINKCGFAAVAGRGFLWQQPCVTHLCHMPMGGFYESGDYLNGRNPGV